MPASRSTVRALAVALTSLVVVTACSGSGGSSQSSATTAPAPVTASTLADRQRIIDITVEGDTPVAEVDRAFISFAVDTAQWVGGRFWGPSSEADPTAGGGTPVARYDFDRPRIDQLVRPFAPAYLRLGGTAADRVWYDLGPDPVRTPPPGFDDVLTAADWDNAADFARRNKLQLVVTLAGGAPTRTPDGAWDPSNAATLVAYAVQHKDPVAAWALTNEPNLFGAVEGISVAGRLADDYDTLRTMLVEQGSTAQVAGPGAAWWPRTGELLQPVTEAFLAAEADVDIVTWHWYPQQSARCPGTVVAASPDLALDQDFLGEVDLWAGLLGGLRDEYAPGTPLWLEETGNAQCGGQAGLSDRFLASFWWVDQLGRLARAGQQVVIRQTLSGADYALLTEPALEPNPDYWASLLWHRLMGVRVLATRTEEGPLLAYAHCTEGTANGSVTMLLVNLDPDEPVSARIAPTGRPLEVYAVTAPDPLGREVVLNGTTLQAQADGEPPLLVPAVSDEGVVDLAPRSYSFVVRPAAEAPACR